MGLPSNLAIMPEYTIPVI